MNKPRLTFWLFAIAGLLWLIVGGLRLMQHHSKLETVLSFTAGFIFLLLAGQMAKRAARYEDLMIESRPFHLRPLDIRANIFAG